VSACRCGDNGCRCGDNIIFGGLELRVGLFTRIIGAWTDIPFRVGAFRVGDGRYGAPRGGPRSFCMPPAGGLDKFIVPKDRLDLGVNKPVDRGDCKVTVVEMAVVAVDVPKEIRFFVHEPVKSPGEGE